MKRSDRSQIRFLYGRRWKTMTRAGYFPTAASLQLAQSFLLLLCLAMAAFPASAQTGASLSVAVTDQPGAALSGVVTDKTGAALADVTVILKSLDRAETRTIGRDGGGC